MNLHRFAVKIGMVMTGDKAFVDTNILLRATVVNIPLHQECETLIKKMWSENIDLWISRQVIREYLVQVTHPHTLAVPLSIDQVMQQISIIQTLFHVADDIYQTTSQLIFLLQNYSIRGKQIHDANIVATMLTYGIDTLLTLNIEDFKRFQDRINSISPITAP